MKALLLMIAISLVGCQSLDPTQSVYGAIDTWAKMEGYKPRTKREPRTWTNPATKQKRRRSSW